MRVRGANSSRLCSRRAVAALALVALICGATLAGSARSQRQTPLRSGPPFALDAYTRMVVKYYEEIKLNDAGDRAVLYDDLGKGKGNCTIGWGRLVHKEPCDGRGSEKPYLDGITLETAESYLTQDIQRVALGPLSRCVKAPLSTGEVTAMVSFMFNLGAGPVCGTIKKPKNGKGKGVFVPGAVGALLNLRDYAALPA